MTTRNKRKLAALNKENCEEHPRSNLAQNSSAPRSQEEYITQVSEEIEGRVTKRLSKEFSRTENRILGALARLDDFLMNPLLLGRSGTTPEPSRNALNTSQGTNEDDSQNDPHPEADHTQGFDSVLFFLIPLDGCRMSRSAFHSKISKMPTSLTNFSLLFKINEIAFFKNRVFSSHLNIWTNLSCFQLVSIMYLGQFTTFSV